MKRCPIVGKCPHEPITIIRNRFFLIEPFDAEKLSREKAIRNTLIDVFGEHGFDLATSDVEITEGAIFCDICRKISSSEDIL